MRTNVFVRTGVLAGNQNEIRDGTCAMRIGICDDKKEARDYIADKAKCLYPSDIIVTYVSGEALLCASTLPDILFLDIQMPQMNGLETARKLRQRDKSLVIIFVTATADHVFEAFDVGAFHYLVKPFTDLKFTEVLKNARKQILDRKAMVSVQSAVIPQKPGILITTSGKHFTVHLEDIIYAEVYNRKIIIHTLDSDIEYYGKMKELEKQAGENFFRPHRAYLVNFRYITKYDAATIYLKKGQALMSKQKYSQFVRQYLHYNQKLCSRS